MSEPSRRQICLGLLSLALPGAARSQAGAQASYSFGVIPQASASQLAAGWSPVLQALSRDSGVPLVFATAPDVTTFERRLADGLYDFAYMNPHHFVRFNVHPGYHALARAKGEQVRGLLVVRKDNPIAELSELAEATLAFPSPGSFAATLLPQAELRRRGIAFRPRYVKTHYSVYRDVAKGLYAAGGGVARTLDLMDEGIARQLRVLWSSQPYTSHPIATRPGLDAGVRARVLAAMLDMSVESSRLKLLADLGFNGLEAARDSDWDDVRRLRLRPDAARD